MLKYPSTHRGKSQNAPPKRLHCTFCTYFLQSLILKAHTQESNSYSKPYLKHMNYHLNHKLQLQQAYEPYFATTTSIWTTLCSHDNHPNLNHNQRPMEVHLSMTTQCPWANATHHRELEGFGMKLGNWTTWSSCKQKHHASESNVEYLQLCAWKLPTIPPTPLWHEEHMYKHHFQ